MLTGVAYNPDQNKYRRERQRRLITGGKVLNVKDDERHKGYIIPSEQKE